MSDGDKERKQKVRKFYERKTMNNNNDLDVGHR